MSESVMDTLAGVIDRCAPTEAESESSSSRDFFARIPESILKNQTVTASELRTLCGIDRCCRGEEKTDARDYQIAEASGQTVPTTQRNLKTLRLKGIILCIGRTCRRIIRMIFGCKSRPETPPTPLKSDGSSTPKLPSKVMGTPIKSDGNSPQIRGQLPSKMMASSKGREESTKGRSSSTSPGDGGSTTTAKKTDAPPTSARPPLADVRSLIEAREAEAEATARRDAEAEARWAALPAATRELIEAEVKAANPGLTQFKPLIHAGCLASMGRLPAVAGSPALVEVLPLDRQLRFQTAMLGSDERAMRIAAFADLKQCGRGDLIPAGYDPISGRTSEIGRSAPREAPGRSPDAISIGRPVPAKSEPADR